MTDLLLAQYEHSPGANVVSGGQCVALAPQLSPLVCLPGSALLAPAHADVLPAASGEI